MENRIRENLKKIGCDYDQLSNKDIDYLNKIERAIIESLEREKELKSQIKDNELSISLISRKINVNRQTIHNRRVLLAYINQRIKDEIQSSVSSFNVISHLKEENEKLHKRDIEYVELSNRYDSLLKKYNSLINKLS